MVEAICTFHDHYLGFGEPNCNARLMEFFFFRVLFVDLYTVSKIQLYSFATDSLFFSKPCTKHMGGTFHWICLGDFVQTLPWKQHRLLLGRCRSEYKMHNICEPTVLRVYEAS